MSSSSPRIFICLFLLFSHAHSSTITYSFLFTEKELNNFLHVYQLEVQILISFNPDDGNALFTTSVINVSPLHFSMWVNGVNCGIIMETCKFKIQPNQPLNIVIYKIDMQSNLLTFIYRGGTQSPDVFINGCSESMSFGSCAYGSQFSTDTRGNSYADSICVCRLGFSTCLLVSNDTCAIIMSMLIGIRMICHFFSPKLRVFFGVMTSPPAALSIGLIIPFTFTMILALFDTQFFERNDSFCWIRPDYIVYAVVIPVVLPIVNGLICSTFAIYKMFFQAKRGLQNKETSHYDAEFWSKVMGLLIMQVAMGLPWGIEFILIGVSGPSPWNYIFVILLGTQGIDLFLIFLYRRQRLVNESRKWSAREEKLTRKERDRQFTIVDDVES